MLKLRNNGLIVMQPRTADGFDAVYVLVDRLTKMAHYVPTRTLHTATQLAQLSL